MANSKEELGMLGLLHTLPACEEFNVTEDATDFLALCRKRIEN